VWSTAFPASASPVRADGYDWRRHDALGLNAAVMCADDIFLPADPSLSMGFRKAWSADILAYLHPEGWDYDRRCAAWPVRRSGSKLNAPVVSSVPALLLSGAYDPITPPAFAYAAAVTLANSTVAVFPTRAHAVVLWGFDSCPFRLAESFFDAPTVKPDLACLAEAKSVRWATTGANEPGRPRS